MMNINEWSSVFLNKLEKFISEILFQFTMRFQTESEQLFVYRRFVLISWIFQMISNRCWALSNTDYWTRCELEIHCNVLWFASKIYLGRHLFKVGCISQTHYTELNRAFVKEAKCIFYGEKLLTGEPFNYNVADV